ncbi:DDE-type integrase/transposase/recombinase [Streptomyces sp. NPDC001492]
MLRNFRTASFSSARCAADSCTSSCRVLARDTRYWPKSDPAAPSATPARDNSAGPKVPQDPIAGVSQLSAAAVPMRTHDGWGESRAPSPDLRQSRITWQLTLKRHISRVHTKKVRTTTRDDGHERAVDLLRRDFTASRPNERWVADFTYVATWSGIVYVAFVVHVFSRAIVGWSTSTSKRAELVLDVLDMALWRRDRAGTPAGPGLVHHRMRAVSTRLSRSPPTFSRPPSTPRSAPSGTPRTTPSWNPGSASATTLNTSPNRRLESTHRASADPGAVHTPTHVLPSAFPRASAGEHRARGRSCDLMAVVAP